MEPQQPPSPVWAAPALPARLRLSADEATHIHAHSVFYDPSEQPRRHSGRGDRGSKSSAHARDSLISHPLSPRPTASPSPASSISSLDKRHRSISQVRGGAHAGLADHHVTRPAPAHVDPEKHAYAHHTARWHSAASPAWDADAVVYDKSEYQEKAPEEKAWQLLFFLSGPCALLSVLLTLYTLLATVFSLATHPFRLLRRSSTPLSTHLTTLLAPALNLQLHLVYSHNCSTAYSASMLVVVLLFSPVVALGVALASWTAAGFWFFSSILGDPGGLDGRNDGKESILGVRKWWEGWLSRGLR